MSLDKRHYSPRPSERKMEKQFHPIYKCAVPNKKNFDRVEALLDEITTDLINGVARSEIIIKLTDKNELHYENQIKSLSYIAADEYLKAAYSRLSLDRDRDVEQVKDALYSQYLNIYRECLESGNLMAAKATLDSLVKLYGIDRAPQNAIQINTDKENGVVINFGFSENEGE